jgi:hypothetical protein
VTAVANQHVRRMGIEDHWPCRHLRLGQLLGDKVHFPADQLFGRRHNKFDAKTIPMNGMDRMQDRTTQPGLVRPGVQRPPGRLRGVQPNNHPPKRPFRGRSAHHDDRTRSMFEAGTAHRSQQQPGKGIALREPTTRRSSSSQAENNCAAALPKPYRKTAGKASARSWTSWRRMPRKPSDSLGVNGSGTGDGTGASPSRTA